MPAGDQGTSGVATERTGLLGPPPGQQVVQVLLGRAPGRPADAAVTDVRHSGLAPRGRRMRHRSRTPGRDSGIVRIMGLTPPTLVDFHAVRINRTYCARVRE